MPVTESNKRESETNIEEVSAKRAKENVALLGSELDAIANQFLGLPVKGHLFELILKHRSEHSIVNKILLKLALKQFKEKVEASEENPHPKFKLIDDHTKFFHFLLSYRTEHQEKKTISEIGLPQPKRDDLEFAPIESVPGLLIPRDDEDLNSKKHFSNDTVEAEKALTGVVTGILDGLEWDEKPIYFENEEEAQALLEQHFSDGRLPKALEHFDDFEKDETISQMAFYGIGQNYLKKATGEDKKIAYDVDTTILSTLEVRPGYEKYGANAFFDEEKNLLEIHVSSLGKTVKPQDDEWKHAKWVWRTSLVFIVTAGTHLAQLHWCVANSAHIASRSKLEADHPIRRVLKVFLYGTGSINMNSTSTLAPENAFLHRMTGLTFDGLSTGLRLLNESFTYETFPDFLASKNLSKEMEEQIPMCTDGRPVWDAFMKFFKGYVDHFYPDENSVTVDVELRRFWMNVDLRGEFGAKKPYGLPKLNKKHLADYLTHLAFSVTAWHELNGTIVHYLKSHKGGALKLRSEGDEADVQTFVQDLILIGLTGGTQPKLMEDWSHLLPDQPGVKKVYKDLKDELNEISKRIDEANATVPCPERPKICQSFNPKHLETSISI